MQIKQISSSIYKTPGNIIIAVGRSNLPVLLDEEGEVFMMKITNLDMEKLTTKKRWRINYYDLWNFTHIAVEASDILRKDGIKISVMVSFLCFDIKSFENILKEKLL